MPGENNNNGLQRQPVHRQPKQDQGLTSALATPIARPAGYAAERAAATIRAELDAWLDRIVCALPLDDPRWPLVVAALEAIDRENAPDDDREPDNHDACEFEDVARGLGAFPGPGDDADAEPECEGCCEAGDDRGIHHGLNGPSAEVGSAFV